MAALACILLRLLPITIVFLLIVLVLHVYFKPPIHHALPIYVWRKIGLVRRSVSTCTDCNVPFSFANTLFVGLRTGIHDKIKGELERIADKHSYRVAVPARNKNTVHSCQQGSDRVYF